MYEADEIDEIQSAKSGESAESRIPVDMCCDHAMQNECCSFWQGNPWYMGGFD